MKRMFAGFVNVKTAEGNGEQGSFEDCGAVKISSRVGVHVGLGLCYEDNEWHYSIPNWPC